MSAPPYKSIRDQILHFYTKDKYADDIYSTKNPLSLYEIFCHVVKENSYNKYLHSTFIKHKHQTFIERNNHEFYSFHHLHKDDIDLFISEVEKIEAPNNIIPKI